MSDEQLRIAVAEAMGWHRCGPYTVGRSGNQRTVYKGIHPQTSMQEELHNFPASLDACSSFEAQLDRDEALAAKYAYEVCRIVSGNRFMSITAKARSRCLAYLATVAPDKLKG